MVNVDKALTIYRKECYSKMCVCVCVLCSPGYHLSREFQQSSPLSLFFLFSSLSPSLSTNCPGNITSPPCPPPNPPVYNNMPWSSSTAVSTHALNSKYPTLMHGLINQHHHITRTYNHQTLAKSHIDKT